MPTAPAVRALVRAWLVYAVTIAALAMAQSWWAVILLWVAAGLAVSGLFVLGHDASHGALTSSRKANRILAQVCMGPSIHVESAWDLGHNRIHHGFTTRQGFDFVWHPATVEEYRDLDSGFRIPKLKIYGEGNGGEFRRASEDDPHRQRTAAAGRSFFSSRSSFSSRVLMRLRLSGDRYSTKTLPIR